MDLYGKNTSYCGPSKIDNVGQFLRMSSFVLFLSPGALSVLLKESKRRPTSQLRIGPGPGTEADREQL